MAIDLGTDGYCEAPDVQAKFGQRTISSSSTPTEAQVEGFITDGFHILDGVLDAVGYVTPVDVDTYTRAGRILKELNALYAASENGGAAHSAGVGGVPEMQEFLMEQFNKKLTMLQKGTLSLPGAPTTADKVPLANDGDPAYQFNVDDDGNTIDPSFTRDMPL